jgi:hypothetical protein
MCSLLFANFGVATGVKCTLHNGVFIAEVLMIRKKNYTDLPTRKTKRRVFAE